MTKYVDRMEILLVEDNLEDANDTIQALRQGTVRRVTLVCDGEEAIRFLRRDGEFSMAPKPDLILMDMQLPKKEGHHVLAEIRADVELKDTPVIVLTGSLVHPAILEAWGLHVDGFMPKPVDQQKFIEVIKSLHRSWLCEECCMKIVSKCHLDTMPYAAQCVRCASQREEGRGS
jgi:two-component system response regulator